MRGRRVCTWMLDIAMRAILIIVLGGKSEFKREYSSGFAMRTEAALDLPRREFSSRPSFHDIFTACWIRILRLGFGDGSNMVIWRRRNWACIVFMLARRSAYVLYRAKLTRRICIE